MLVVSLLLAPLMMDLATLVERRLGPSAGGWVTALPVGFAVAVIAVTLDAGPRAASTLALSAAMVFLGLSTRRLVAGLTAGTCM